MAAETLKSKKAVALMSMLIGGFAGVFGAWVSVAGGLSLSSGQFWAAALAGAAAALSRRTWWEAGAASGGGGISTWKMPDI